jgi:hypothetical protein
MPEKVSSKSAQIRKIRPKSSCPGDRSLRGTAIEVQKATPTIVEGDCGSRGSSDAREVSGSTFAKPIEQRPPLLEEAMSRYERLDDVSKISSDLPNA